MLHGSDGSLSEETCKCMLSDPRGRDEALPSLSLRPC